MAVVDYFLKIEGLEGEAQDAKHKGAIDLLTFNFGAHQSGGHHGGGGGGVGKVSYQDITCSMLVNKATPKLLQACSSGEHYKKATIICRKAGKEQQEYFKVILTDLLISSCSIGGPYEGTSLPVTNLTINYAKIQVEYREQKPDGSLAGAITSGWDLKINAAV